MVNIGPSFPMSFRRVLCGRGDGGRLADNHDSFMAVALEAARAAYDRGEVPVGAALVIDGLVVETDHNRTIEFRDPSAHAETLVLSRAARAGHDLGRATLYVTLEPCIMCAGAIVLSRVGTLVYGADDPKAGAVRSLYTAVTDTRLNHRCRVVHGVCAGEASDLLKRFFRELRLAAADRR